MDRFLGATSHFFAYSCLLEYALCPFVERIIESIHAIIQRIGRQAPNSSPPHIIARVREEQSFGLLRRSIQFHNLVVQSWSSNKLLSDVLSLCFPASVVQDMSRLTKIKKIYQCHVEGQHENVLSI